MTRTRGQQAALTRAWLFALYLLFALAMILTAPSTTVPPVAWLSLAVAWTLVGAVAASIVRMDWRGLSIVRCRRCDRTHNINAACPGCGQ